MTDVKRQAPETAASTKDPIENQACDETERMRKERMDDFFTTMNGTGVLLATHERRRANQALRS